MGGLFVKIATDKHQHGGADLFTVNIKPLSVNRAWQGRRFKTDEYKAYERNVSLMLPLSIPIPEGRLVLTIEAGFSNPASDIDNIVKPFVDILQKRYGFNDKRVYQMHLIKKVVKKGSEYIAWVVNPMDKQ